MNHRRIFQALIFSETDQGKDRSSRLQQVYDWLQATDARVDDLDLLPKYARHLFEERGLSQNTVRGHISTFRARMNELIDDDTIKQLLLKEGMTEIEVEAALRRITKALTPKNFKIDVMPTAPSAVKLKRDEHVTMLLNSIETADLIGLRDFTLISVMAATGIGSQEVGALHVKHVRCWGLPILHVPQGPGCTERLIPYGYDGWVMKVMETWLEQAEIEAGPVFRGFYKGGRTLRNTPLSSQSVEQIVGNHPVGIGEESIVLKPNDLRQAYARHIFRLGKDIDTVGEYLGYSTEPPVLSLLDDVIYEPQTGEPYDVDLWRF